MTDHSHELHQEPDEWQSLGKVAARVAGEINARRLRRHQGEEPISGGREEREPAAQ